MHVHVLAPSVRVLVSESNMAHMSNEHHRTIVKRDALSLSYLLLLQRVSSASPSRRPVVAQGDPSPPCNNGQRNNPGEGNKFVTTKPVEPGEGNKQGQGATGLDNGGAMAEGGAREEVMTAQKQAQQLEVSEMTTHSARRARAEDAFYQHIDSYTKVESPRQDKARDTEPLEVPLARDKGPLAREDLGEGEASDDEEVRRAYIV